MPSSRRAGISLASASALRMSETVTWAPRWRRNRAAARPDFPSPTTRTFLPLRSITGSALQSAGSALRAKIAPDEAATVGRGGPSVEGENEVRSDFLHNPSGPSLSSRFHRRSSPAYTRYASLLTPRTRKNWLRSVAPKIGGQADPRLNPQVPASHSCDAPLFYSAPHDTGTPAGLTEFQRGECKQCKHQGRDPEANDDFRFVPSQLLKVVMKGRHLEDTLFAQLVAAHLQHH